MPRSRLDPALVFAWQAAHSIARGSPTPVRDRGGMRVDTGSEREAIRWVFPRMCEGLRAIARDVTAPRHALKLCGTDEVLLDALPDRWELLPANHFMIATTATFDATSLPDGYRLEVHRAGAVTRACILAPDGELAAAGCAAETSEAFVYDRIETGPDHRRKGLGIAVMAALGDARRSSTTPQLLVATEEGRGLYAKLGWKVLAPVAAAAIPER